VVTAGLADTVVDAGMNRGGVVDIVSGVYCGDDEDMGVFTESEILHSRMQLR